MRSDEFWIFGTFKEEEFNLNKLSTDILTELYLTQKLSPQTEVKYISFAKAGVPKYTNRKKWAITEKEKAEEI